MILDTNRFGILKDGTKEFRKDEGLLRNWIRRGDGRLAYSRIGKYSEEIRKDRTVFGLFEEYRRSNRLALVSKEDYLEHAETIGQRSIESDDPHILALARASGARMLCTCDGDLRKDFKNRELVPGLGGGSAVLYPLGSSPTERRKFLDRRKCRARDTC